MTVALSSLKHIVVLMMSGRSFDHMLGSLKNVDPRIDGLTGVESNTDITGATVRVQPQALFQSQLDPQPDHHFPAVDLQIYNGANGAQRIPNMQGFVRSYFEQHRDVQSSHKVMYYFTPEKLPVLTTLATQYALFNGWFSSIPGPAICNRLFAHYGSSFGQVSNQVFHGGGNSIYERLVSSGHSAKIYYYDEADSTVDTVNFRRNQPGLFATYDQFVSDCRKGALPNYSFIHPNHSDREGDGGLILASDQNPDHNVQAGEIFIASIYNSIRANPALWTSTVLLIVYDQHGGLYDHVPPPQCLPDGYVADAGQTGTGSAFRFDRLGVRVPAVLVSPWIPRGTVVENDRIFEHASIPATVTNYFLGDYGLRTPRERTAQTFLDILSLPAERTDTLIFNFDNAKGSRSKVNTVWTSGQTEAIDSHSGGVEPPANPSSSAERTKSVLVPPVSGQVTSSGSFVAGPSTHVARDRWTTDDSLGHYPYAYAIYRFLTDPETRPPLTISIQAPWGGGKTSLMRMVQSQLDPNASDPLAKSGTYLFKSAKNATVGQVLSELDSTIQNPPDKGSAQADVFQAGMNFPVEPASSSQTQPTIPPIQNPGERRVTVWFNAWKYESTAQVWAGLADCIVQQIGERMNPVERELFWFRLQLRRLDAKKIRRQIHQEIFSAFSEKLLRWSPLYLTGLCGMGIAVLNHSAMSAGALLVAGFAGGGFHFWKAQVETQEKPARLSLAEFVQAPDYAANLGFVHEVVEDLRVIFSIIPKKHLPMVVFIDDLDRCSPGKVADVVEAINLFLAGEFPDCMFILGIDDEMVAAALDKAHSEVIAKLPTYARSSSIGWRFMDKFVQLPFVIPPSSEEELSHYVESLLSPEGGPKSVNMEARDLAARVVEVSTSQMSPDEIVGQVSAAQPLEPAQKGLLKDEVKIIQDMNENIRNFSDQETHIHYVISLHANQYFQNPRDTKRFVNLFRFYYFLFAARQARRLDVPTLDQLCRWLAFSLKWPEVVRWLRRHATPKGFSESSIEVFEQIGSKSKDFAAWQSGINKALGLRTEQTPWLTDEALYNFFKTEALDHKAEDRLSSCADKGLW